MNRPTLQNAEKASPIRVMPNNVVSLEVEDAHLCRDIAHKLTILLVFLKGHMHAWHLICGQDIPGGTSEFGAAAACAAATSGNLALPRSDYATWWPRACRVCGGRRGCQCR